jgi:hypothetical protein
VAEGGVRAAGENGGVGVRQGVVLGVTDGVNAGMDSDELAYPEAVADRPLG